MQDAILRQVVEICILYFFGIMAIAARIWCRTKMIGFKGYDIDDWLVIGVAGMWTSAPFIGCFYVAVAESRHTSELTHEQREQMSPSEYHHWEYGSQMFLFGLVGYFFIIWTLKFNMLCFYRRVVRGLWSEKFVKPVMGLVLVSAVVIILTISLTCRPFQALWQVWPDPGANCVPQNLVFFITILTFNLMTDVCIMLIPLPVVMNIKGRIWRRLGIYLCFTMGVFCMFAAVLRFVLIFRLHQTGDAAMWSMREDFVGIVVGQAPLLTPLFRKKFWVNAGYASRGKSSHSGGLDRSGQQSHELSSTSRSGKRKPRDPYSITAIGAGESEEEIVANGQDTGKKSPPVSQSVPSSDTESAPPAVVEEGRSPSPPKRAGGTHISYSSYNEGIRVEHRVDIESGAVPPEFQAVPNYYGGWNDYYPRSSRPHK